MEFMKLFCCLLVSILGLDQQAAVPKGSSNGSAYSAGSGWTGSGNLSGRQAGDRPPLVIDINISSANSTASASPLSSGSVNSAAPLLPISNGSASSGSPAPDDIFDQDFWKLSVPALLYFIQNNLLYVAIENLDSLTFQLLYQLKIITTALFSVSMLGRRLSGLKWFSLLTLFIGVVVVQYNAPSSGPSTSVQSAALNTVTASIIENNNAQQQQTGFFSSKGLIGVSAVLVSSITSGFSGVYFEKILKSSKSVSIWHRNIQLGIFSCIFATINLFLVDLQRILNVGFFFGYSPVVWGVIANQALGGLLVAVVVKYADNILKGFATSASIILGGIAGVVWLDLHVNAYFLFGATLVLSAVYLYSKPDAESVMDSPKIKA